MRLAHRLIVAVLAVGLAPTSAAASNQALLIGEPPAGAAALTGIWNRLESGYGFTDVRIATAASPHEIGDDVRRFLAAPGGSGDLRLVWIAAGADKAVCPAWSEDYVRPLVPTVIVAPACLKFLVQAPSTYERLAAADASAPTPGAPGVVFVSTGDAADVSPAGLLAALDAPAGSGDGEKGAARALVAALACADEDKLTVDFSPSSAAWQIVPPLCARAQAAAPAAPAEPSPFDIEDAAAAPAADAPDDTASLPMPPPARPDDLAGAEAPQVAAVPVMPVTSAPLAEPGAPSFAAPVDGTVVADFGSAVAGKANKGIDFEAPAGSAVKAAAAGQVVYVGDLPGYGKVVAIKHGDDWATVYGHAGEIDVAKGQTVAQGQEIAKLDATAHRLHFEIRRRGLPVNPHPMLAAASP